MFLLTCVLCLIPVACSIKANHVLVQSVDRRIIVPLIVRFVVFAVAVASLVILHVIVRGLFLLPLRPRLLKTIFLLMMLMMFLLLLRLLMMLMMMMMMMMMLIMPLVPMTLMLTMIVLLKMTFLVAEMMKSFSLPRFSLMVLPVCLLMFQLRLIVLFLRPLSLSLSPWMPLISFVLIVPCGSREALRGLLLNCLTRWMSLSASKHCNALRGAWLSTLNIKNGGVSDFI